MRIIFYYMFSLFGGLFAVPLALIGAKFLVDTGRAPFSGGHSTLLSFFIPLIAIAVAYVFLYGVLSGTFSAFGIPKEMKRLRHFFITLVMFIISVLAGGFSVVLCEKLLHGSGM